MSGGRAAAVAVLQPWPARDSRDVTSLHGQHVLLGRPRSGPPEGFIIAQPPAYVDPNAINSGYCAFHDYTLPGSPGNSYYQGISTVLSYTNMPYSLAINSGGVNVCGENAVNSGSSGTLEGFSIVLGHEIEETITDPGAEDVLSTGPSGTQTYYGGLRPVRGQGERRQVRLGG